MPQTNPSGNFEAFVLAVIAFAGFFVYAIVVSVEKITPDPVIFPVIGMTVTLAGTFFFSSHIANGAAGKALDAMVQTGKERDAAIKEKVAEPVPPKDGTNV